MGVLATHQSTHPWLDCYGAALISYNRINVVYREIVRMCLTQEEELSASKKRERSDNGRSKGTKISESRNLAAYPSSVPWKQNSSLPLTKPN